MIDFESLLKKSREASKQLLTVGEDKINKVLLSSSKYLLEDVDSIKRENIKDIEKAKERGVKSAFIDRLTLSEKVINGIAEGIKKVASLKSPYNKVVYRYKNKKQNIDIQKKLVPFGVIGIVFEARPNVAVDAFSLCLKTRNAVVLRGGSDALNSNRIIVNILRRALRDNGINEDSLILIDDATRESSLEFIKRRELDLLIPRGGAKLIDSVVQNATVPVIQTGKGNCHIFVDKSADIESAVEIVDNAKTQRPSVCNACETVVLHSQLNRDDILKIAKRLEEKNVEMRCDERSYEILKGLNGVIKATEEDYLTEYNDYIITVKMVDGLSEAISYINKYSSGHSEAIITRDKENAETFLNLVDSACVYDNASTRFSDGFVFGLGAEIGISTQKLHARGPMGLNELMTTKYFIKGKGSIRK